MEVVLRTNNPDRDRLPSWSPDGRHIAFVSQRYGRQEVLVIETGGAFSPSAAK